jgi:hypothetical protein
MKRNEKSPNYQTKATLDISDKGHLDYLTRQWGVSIHRLKAAVRATNNGTVKQIEQYLRENGAI